MCAEQASDGESLLVEALKHLRAAIVLLDRAQAPAQIAAHVDLATHQLSDAFGRDPIVTTLDREESRAPLAH